MLAFFFSFSIIFSFKLPETHVLMEDREAGSIYLKRLCGGFFQHHVCSSLSVCSGLPRLRNALNATTHQTPIAGPAMSLDL